jgi:hypothetical protein
VHHLPGAHFLYIRVILDSFLLWGILYPYYQNRSLECARLVNIAETLTEGLNVSVDDLIS